MPQSPKPGQKKGATQETPKYCRELVPAESWSNAQSEYNKPENRLTMVKKVSIERFF